MLLAVGSSSRAVPPPIATTGTSRPLPKAVILYDIHKLVPDVSAAKKIGNSPVPRAPKLAARTQIATSPQPKSYQQLIWQPSPKIQIKQDLPLPNVVMRAGLLELPPVPEEPKPVSPPPPETPRTVKPFVAPPRVIEQAEATPQLAEFVAPPVELVAPTMPSPGNANANLAVISLRPNAATNGTVPAGERSGRFAEATVKGPLSTGEAGGLSIPNLTVRAETPKKIDKPAIKLTPVLYTEKVRNLPPATFAAPLRPGSRAIPQTIEARFPGRNVYTLVVPIENLPVYEGDWIVWFAEKNAGPGNTPLIRPPVPYRKMEPDGATRPSDKPGQRFQLTATVTKEGKIEGISMVSKGASAFTQAVLGDLASWEFRPATRDGAAIDVDIVVEIPYNVSVIAERQNAIQRPD